MTKTTINPAVDWLSAHVQSTDTILCATSGGLDSMCLAHLLHQLGYPVVIAHYHHGLRETASEDAAFVEAWCQARGLPFVMERGDVAHYAKAQGLGIEEAGRTLRYAFLHRTATAHGCAWIATAHHGDDNVETMVLNLCRGTGLAGLCGIPAISGKLIRPFLGVSRQDLETFALAQHLAHVEDATNQDVTFVRNRVRHQVVPVLETINPQAVAHFAQTAKQLTAENAYLTAQAQAIPRTVTDTVITFLWADLDADPVLAPRAVHQAMSQLSGHSRDITAQHIDSMLSLPRRTAQVSLPYGLVAKSTTNTLLVEKPMEMPTDSLLIVENPVPFGHWLVELSTVPLTNTSLQVHLADAPLAVTPWQRQDRMGSRSLKRCFVDAGMSPAQRDTLPTVRNTDGVIAVVNVGVHPDFVSSGDGTSPYYITFTYKGDCNNG